MNEPEASIEEVLLAPSGRVEIDESKWQVWLEGQTKTGERFQARVRIGTDINADAQHVGAVVWQMEGVARELIRKHNEDCIA